MRTGFSPKKAAAVVAVTASVGLAGAATWAAAPASVVSASPRRAPASGASACGAGKQAVTVDGTATVQGSPDEMTVSLGAHTSAPSAQAAMAANAERAQALINVLAAAGVPKADVQTSNLSVQPDYNSDGLIRGYEVDNDLTVTLKGALELAKAGSVLDAAGRAAGSSFRIDGISFSVSDEQGLMAEARAAAVRDAKSQAAAMAAAAGEALGALCSLQDQSQSQPPPPVPLGALAPSATTTPVEPGSEQLTATVTAVYALVPAG